MFNALIIEQMRRLAQAGGGVPAMVSFLREQTVEQPINTLTIFHYFMESFGLDFGEVRRLQEAECMGNVVYSDEEINAMLLPLIRDRLKDK